MPAFDDKTNKKFGRLRAIELHPDKAGNSLQWVCLCDCGNYTVVRAGALNNGNTTSCGCVKKENLIKRNTSHSKSKTKEYLAWKDMKKRCYNKNNKRYHHYSSKGITVCDEWINDFAAFLDYIGEAPKDGQTWSVGRIDNNAGYAPGNVRWELLAEQARNHSLQCNNKTGINGIGYRERVIAGNQYTFWVATWSNGFGVKGSKEFSVDKYGFDTAKQMAIDHRCKMIDSFKENGIIYAESHGTRVGE